MSHENSAVTQKHGRWYLTYGPGTDREGNLLPVTFDWEKSYYRSQEEAEAAARRRSREWELQGKKKHPQPAKPSPLEEYRRRRLLEEQLLKNPQGP